MQPLQYDSRLSAAKDSSCSAKQPWRSHYNAISRYWIAKHNRTTCNGVRSRRQSKKITILKHFLRGICRKITSAKLKTSIDKWLSQPWCTHFNTIHSSQLQKTIVLRTPRRQATLTQPLQCVFQHQVANTHLSTHMATKRDTNHAAITAICNQRFNKRKELRTNEQPLVAEHRGGTDYARNDPSRNRRTQEVPFIAGCSHFTRKNTRFRAPASLQQAPCNIHAAITMHFAAWRG